ncbi:hypothetical protein HQ576_07995, partial [bacterium]|nr:hypothetical protein [bacterium]
MRLIVAICAALIVAFGAALPAAATPLFLETFDTDTATTAQTVATYPHFTYTGPDTIAVIGGVVNLTGTSSEQNFRVNATHAGNIVVHMKVGSSPGGGSTNVGLRLGDNRLVFHPGFSVGAFRIEGPNGIGNQNMGYTPTAGALHDMHLTILAGTGTMLINVSDPTTPSSNYHVVWTDPGYNPAGETMGPTRLSGGVATTSIYDDLTVEKPTWNSLVRAAAPLHWYRLEETGGDTTAIDSGRAGANGTYQNGAELGQGQQGLVGGAVQFDGINDQINIGQGSLGGDWTAEFIIEKTAVEQAASLLRSGAGALRLDQWNNTGQVGFTIFGTADFLFSPAVSVATGGDVHLVYAADQSAGTISVYLNGLLMATSANYMALPLDTIGSLDAFNGVLDELVVYDRLLSDLEIQLHAQAAIPEPATMALLALGG